MSRYLVVRTAVRATAALVASTLIVLAMTWAANLGAARECGWRQTHDRAAYTEYCH